MTRNARRISVRTAAPDYRIEAEARRIGDDVLVCIYGGDKPHIGAVAAAEPRSREALIAWVLASAFLLAYVDPPGIRPVGTLLNVLSWSALPAALLVTAVLSVREHVRHRARPPDQRCWASGAH